MFKSVFVYSGFVVVCAWWAESESDEAGDKLDEDTADDETDTDLTDQEYKENQQEVETEHVFTGN